jgi:hypothetical protein
MAVQLKIPYETVLNLVEQLPEEQKHELLTRLLNNAENRPLTKEEKKTLYHSSILSIPVNEEPSIRREDWYDDDGR